MTQPTFQRNREVASEQLVNALRAHFRLGAKMGKLAALGPGEPPWPKHALK